MDKEELIEKIISKNEFSKLPRKDVELAFDKFDKDNYSNEEKVKKTREFLRKVFTAFMGRRIMNPKEKDLKWFLVRHVSTKERFDFFEKIYLRILKYFDNCSIIDLGAGINGLSYEYFQKLNKKVNYVGIEAVGQLVDVVNSYFKKNKFSANMVHESLFELDNVKKIIRNEKKPKIGFMFKVVDGLEILKRDYTKDFLLEIVPMFDKFVISFATRSLFRKNLFNVKRDWIIYFLKENFKILDDFEFGGERYLVLCKR